MKTFFVGIEVEAENEEAAKDIAFDKFYFGEWENLKIMVGDKGRKI